MSPSHAAESTTGWSRLSAPAWSLPRCLISVVVAAAMALFGIPSMIATTLNASILGALGVGLNDKMYGSLNSLLEKGISLVVVLTVMLIILRPISRRVISVRFQPLARIIIIGLLGAVVLNVCVRIWAAITSDGSGGQSQLKAFGAGEGFASDLALVIAIVVFAPVFEELMFRAMLYLPLRDALNRFGRPLAVGVAGFGSAFAFAGIHLDSTQVKLFPIYVLYGLLTAAAYELSGSLIGPVVLHASSNAWAFASPGAASVVSTQTQVAAVLAVVLAVALAWLSGLVLDALGGDKRR